MPSFQNLNTAAGLQELNKHLETRSYVEGFKPSGADVSLLSQITASVDSSAYPHVSRWLSHLTSFTPAQRSAFGGAVAASAAPAKPAAAEKKAAKKAADSDDDFGFDDSDDSDDEAAEILARKNAEMMAKKASKPKPVAKSSVILFVKPLEAETNMDELAQKIKTEVVMESLQWGDYELIPVAFGIKKLRIICIIEDDKISLDDLTEAIEEFEEVQSVDIDAFNKL